LSAVVSIFAAERYYPGHEKGQKVPHLFV